MRTQRSASLIILLVACSMTSSAHGFSVGTCALIQSFCLEVSGPRAIIQQSSPVRLDTAAPKPVNLDFEEGQPGRAPTGWFA
ncbi:MAG TPA: hypothetical protein VFV34_03305, partial [Blastocatellia bacterium]|nr:hypothetical protein [Blastocatellia bacterium]